METCNKSLDLTANGCACRDPWLLKGKIGRARPEAVVVGSSSSSSSSSSNNNSNKINVIKMRKPDMEVLVFWILVGPIFAIPAM